MSAILKKCDYFGLSPAIFGLNKSSKRKRNLGKKKTSEYGIQLKEKQKLKFIYGVRERQFRNYFMIAVKDKHKTGESLLQLLEFRLDNVIFRLGFACTRREARMLVVHCHFKVNGRIVNIPSYLVKVGDVIELKENSKKSAKFKSIAETSRTTISPSWLDSDKENFVGKILQIPSREDIDVPVEEGLVVVLYSK